jgi:endonuclease/exonuclease/phosphatase family metal-dependent hydrolase
VRYRQRRLVCLAYHCIYRRSSLHYSLTPKGFTFLRVKVADGVWFDLYNLHTDAGDEDGDRAARMSDLAQVRDYITMNSEGMAVIVMGDTNSRYTSEVDSDSLRDLINSAGLTDSWVRNTRGGVFPVEGTDPLVCPFPFPSGTTQATMVACETVDKLLVRGSAAFTLVPTSFKNENDAFLNNTGYPLSDHYPISSIISWALSSSLRLSDPIGGPHGDHFSDINLVNGTTIPKISTLTIRTGSRMDAVSYTLSSGNSGSHGGTGGDPQTLTLASSEFITRIFGCQAQKDGDTRVFFIQFTTNTGRTLSGGTITDTCFTLSVPNDAGADGKKWGLVAFYGRSGDEMDQLAAIWGATY